MSQTDRRFRRGLLDVRGKADARSGELRLNGRPASECWTNRLEIELTEIRRKKLG